MSLHRKNTCLGILLVIALPGLVSCDPEVDCQATNEGTETMGVEQVSLVNSRGKLVDITAMIADDANERAQGYQHICSEVIDSTTILFVYPTPIMASFHMSNVKAPLDIGFFDAQGKLVSVQKMETYTETHKPLYSPGRPFRFALEARAGFFAESGFAEQTTRLIPGSIGDGE